MKKRYFMEGLKSGLPICLGYFSVSIAFGMMAIHLKRPIGEAVLISLTNLTSAGQFAGLKIIGNRGGLIEVFLSTLIINARYFLMSLSISQKLAPKTKWYEKLLIAYGITDEIFAISMSQTRALTFSYMMGVIVISVFDWVSGTFVGGIASSLLPVSVMDAFGIALYGMFIAIVIPAIKKNRNNRIAVMIALVLSTFFYFSSWLSEGWSIIVITVGVSALMAWLCPIDQKEEAFVDGLEGNAGDDDHDVRDPA